MLGHEHYEYIRFDSCSPELSFLHLSIFFDLKIQRKELSVLYINTQVKRQDTWDWKEKRRLSPDFLFFFPQKNFIQDMKNRTIQKPTEGMNICIKHLFSKLMSLLSSPFLYLVLSLPI